MSHRVIRMLLLAAVVTAYGCQQHARFPLTLVEGTISQAGEPLSEVLVVYIPEPGHGALSTGVTDSEGRYRLRG